MKLKYPYNIWNEKESIELNLQSYEDLFDLLDFRRELRKEIGDDTLGNFYILNGKYHIDNFAQICKVIYGVDELNKHFNIPYVMSDDAFYDTLRKYDEKMNAITDEEYKGLEISEIRKLNNSGRPFPISITTSMNSSLPGRNTVCPHCGKGWDLNNIDDCLRHSQEWKSINIKEVDLYNDILFDFTGQPLQKFWDFIQMRRDAIYYSETNHGITNSKWVDLSPDPKYPTLYKNANGFFEGEVNGDYILQEGDKVGFSVVKCYHKKCNREFLNTNETTQFEKCFLDAGFEKEQFELIPIPNEYCHDVENCTICANWFNVSTEYGIIKIGWRKRVINIDWSNINDILVCNGNIIFEDQETTKGENYVHAWGNDKCTEYLLKLKETFDIQLRNG